MKKILFLLGRICLSLIFITAVTNHILSWEGTVQFFTNSLCDWMTHVDPSSYIAKGLNTVLSHASMAVLIGTILAGIGGILVLLGVKVRLGVACLILFLIPVTLTMHAFWLYQGPGRDLQMVMFLKNLSIIGGLFILAASDTGAEA